MVVKMLVKDSANTTKIEQNQEPIIGAAMKARLEQTIIQSTPTLFYFFTVSSFFESFFIEGECYVS
jgi:hypothetical protein